MRKLFILAALIAFSALALWPERAPAASVLPEDTQKAVILTYQRIGEDDLPDSSLKADQFIAQIDEISKGGYMVLPLQDIIRSIKNRETLPPGTIAITFEGGFQSAYANAIPLLLEKKIPFTIFYSGDQAEAGGNQFISLENLQSLSRNELVTLGLLPDGYHALSSLDPAARMSEINQAIVRHRKNFTSQPLFYAYPYGAYSKSYRDQIEQSGFIAAFGLQSGPVSPKSDLFALPRFVMTEKYGDIERFIMAANSLPLPVQDIQPADSFMNAENISIGFTVTKPLTEQTGDLTCFVSDDVPPVIEKIGSRIEIRPATDARREKMRVNCTMAGPAPDPDEPERIPYRWFGMLLFAQ